MRKRKRRRRGSPRATPLTTEQILTWADQWFQRCGTWPQARSGRIPGSLGEKWARMESALRLGHRGLPGGRTLARLLAAERGVRNRKGLPKMTVAKILAWADAHRRRTGAWPREDSGPIVDAPGENWHAVSKALRIGSRGLPGGSSLARVLAQHRGVRNNRNLPRLTPQQVLAWADAWHGKTAQWPHRDSGPIPDAPGEAWNAIDLAMYGGLRGYRGDSSLARLLERRRGVRNIHHLPPLTSAAILGWADAHHRRTGEWPKVKSGPIPEARRNLSAIDTALHAGLRGLPGGSSLARLLTEHRGVPNRMEMPPLTVPVILAWADYHHRRTGAWPNVRSGPIDGVAHTTWLAVQTAVDKGCRGLPGGSSLWQLLVAHGRISNCTF